jgi:hypothetical protein
VTLATLVSLIVYWSGLALVEAARAPVGRETAAGFEYGAD